VAYTSEIEKLERRYAENPKGRNFAPLADAYRKAGQLDQAIELCTSGLEHHPDYVSAHIVYGRCLIDQHNDDTAGAVFRKVLELDPENVIAFKVLAEIGARSGRLDEAVLWLTKLLAADPMNGDAAEALAVAKGKASQAAKASTPVTPVPPPFASAAPELPDIVLDPDPVQPAGLPLESGQSSSDIEVFDGTLDFSAVANSTARADGIEIHEEIVLQPSEIAVEGLARTQYEASGLFKLDAEPEEDDPITIDLPLIMPDSEEVTGAPENAAAASARAFASPAPPAPPHAATPGRRLPVPSGGTPAAVTLSDDDGAADTAALSRAEPVVTETMAELYLKQGHEEEALRVFRALQAQRPDDRRLRAKVDALSGGGTGDWGRGRGVAPSGQPLQTFLKGILARRPGVAAAAAAEPELTGASPLDSAFATAAPDPDPPGEPTRAAADDLSLDQVFGDDAPGPAGRTTAAPRPEAAAPAPPAPGGFSFDEFFSAGGAPDPRGSSAAPDSVPRASGSRARPPSEEDGDLDQFQSWLKGLKS
jgi:tetratricopeptide (TPR) repeat protein